MESNFKIAVIGLGLIGGSMAYALRGFRSAHISGCDKNPEVCAAAKREKAVHEAFESAGDAIDGADLVIFCTYPEAVPKLIEQNRMRFKQGAVISDVSGVKGRLSEEIAAALPPYVDYVGGHPMAGKEVDGFENASPELFWMCGYIITPIETSKKESVDLIADMAHYIGATRITAASPKLHDEVIAYTSDLMHIAASALCLDYNEDMNRAYTAGAFRDCTRVAEINPELWSELFCANSSNVVREIDRLMGSLNVFRVAVDNRDRAELKRILTLVRDNKRTMQSREPERKTEVI